MLEVALAAAWRDVGDADVAALAAKTLWLGKGMDVNGDDSISYKEFARVCTSHVSTVARARTGRR